MPNYLYSFISHAHSDNALCDPLADEMTRLGIPHYYDRQNPQVGHSLSLALQQEIERASVLIVLVSPASLASFWVNEEIDMFYALMSEDPSRKLIPIKIAPCELPPRLKSRWWLDATRLSHEAIIAQLAAALDGSTSPLPLPTPAPTDSPAPKPAPTEPSAEQQPSALQRPSGFSRIVDSTGGGDHTTIQEAIKAASADERILIRKGVYEEHVVIEKPLVLLGDGKLGDVEIRATEKEKKFGTALLFETTHGRLANLVIDSLGQRDSHNEGWTSGLTIKVGRPIVEDCEFGDHLYRGIVINGTQGSAPQIRRCRIHNTGGGISIYGGTSLIEDCDIVDNDGWGIYLSGGIMHTVRRCRINRNHMEAFKFTDVAGGTFEENDLRNNPRGAWNIEWKSVLLVRRRNNIE